MLKYLLSFVIVLGAPSSYAGHESKGGNSVVCFTTRVKADTKITRLKVISAVSLEHYITKKASGTHFLSSLRDDLDNFDTLLATRVASVPPLYEIFKTVDHDLPPIETGYGFAEGIPSTDDVKIDFILPPNCKVVQTVSRRVGGVFFYDSFVWAHLSPFDRKLLRAHEIIYEIQVRAVFPPEATSYPATNVLLALLSDSFVGKNFRNILIDNGFGKFLTQSGH